MATTTEISRRLSIFFNGDERMIRDYIETYGESVSMRYIQNIRDKYEGNNDPFAALEGVVKTEEEKVAERSKENPCFSIKVDCPACKKWGLELYELKAKSQIIEYDPFMMPVHKPHGNFDSVNFNAITVCVCPRCLFASPDRKDFMVYSKTKQETLPSQIPLSVLSEVQDRMAERLCIREESPAEKELFQEPRSPAAGILSYQLADNRAAVEADSGIPFAWFKRGNYWLKIALLQRQLGKDDAKALETASKYLKEAFLRTDFPNRNIEFQTCYTIFMIKLRQEELKEARDYVGIMEKTKKELETSGADGTAALEKWITKAKNIWEDRKEPHIWVTPGLDAT